jgi:membrane fusion protein, heavy metal efflux system
MMNRTLLITASLAVGVTAGGLLSPALPQFRKVLATTGLVQAAEEKVPAAAAAGKTSQGEQLDGAKESTPPGVVPLSEAQIADQDITVAPVKSGTISRHITVPGTIVPDVDRIARIPARVGGTVAEMRKRLGDTVKKGEIVTILDSREIADAKSEYLTATVNYELQKTTFERAQSLWDKRISAEQQFLQVKATFAEAQLRFDLARQKLSALGIDADEVASAARRDAGPGQSSLRRFEIRSPIAGRVVERKVDIGTAVGKEGDPSDLYTITDLSAVWVELTVTRSDVGKVKENAKVSIVTTGEDEKRGEAKIVFVSPILNPDTRSATVIAALDNQDLSWRPGSFVTAEIEVGEDPAKVLVPRSALQTIGGERVVFVRTEKGFERRDVKTGKADDDSFEILSGLATGETIATKNTFLLKAELGKSEAKHDD